MPANVVLLDRMLRGEGYVNVSSTQDSGKVCELHLTHRYDLILLDLQMPGMDGFQVMENLKELETGSYLPVLVITAQPQHKLRALKAGAKDFLSKPLDLAEVLIRVRNMLEVRLLHRETRRLYDLVVAEQTASARLLSKPLPDTGVEALIHRPEVVPDSATEIITESHASVTVLFADILDFTAVAEGKSAEVLVGVLRALGTGGPTRHKAILGDAYIAAMGLPADLANRSLEAAKLALDLAVALDRFNALGRYKLKVRVGVETGALVNGAVKKRTSGHDL